MITQTLADHLRQSGGLEAYRRVPDREVISRCMAAAKAVTRRYADAQDTAAEVILELTAAAAAPPAEHGSPRDVLRWIERVERNGRPAIERRQLRAGVLKLRARRCLARKLTQHEARIEQAETGSLADVLDTLPEEPAKAPLALSPAAATHATAKLADLLGLPLLGGVREVIYSILRDADGPELAAELGVTPGSLRVLLTRGRKVIVATYPEPEELLAALLLLDPPAKEARKRTRCMAQDARTDNGLTYPVTESRLPWWEVRSHWRSIGLGAAAAGYSTPTLTV